MPPTLITPPALTPGRRGLLAVATTPADIPTDWLHGIVFGPEACAAPDPFPWVICGDEEDLDDATARPSGAEWQPVLLRGVDTCSTLDGFNTAEREARARAVLAATASHQAEREFSDATASDAGPGDPNPHLTDAAGWLTVETATAAADDPAQALGLLEDALADCLHGQRGMLHARPGVVALWDAAGALHMEGQLLVTANDNVVVSGSGYSGNSPVGAAPAAGSSWVYGTGLVYQIRGAATLEGEPFERVDRAQNTIVTWVTQPAVVFTSPCCKVAAQVAIT